MSGTPTGYTVYPMQLSQYWADLQLSYIALIVFLSGWVVHVFEREKIAFYYYVLRKTVRIESPASLFIMRKFFVGATWSLG